MAQYPRRQLAWLCLVTLLWACPAMGQNTNITVNDQPTAEQKLEEVLVLRRAQRYTEAAELVQELIESARFKLVALGDGTYTDAGRWAEDILLRDGALREAYSERYNAVAARAYEMANASPDRLAGLLGVYRLYGATSSGLDAGLAAAGLLLESGQAQSGATLTAELARHPDREAANARLLLLRGAAAAYLGDQQMLAEMVEDLADLDPSHAQQLTALADAIQPSMVAAGHARFDMGRKPVSIRAPLWDQALATANNSERWLLSDELTVPVVTPAMVLVNNGRQVVALDRASGQRAWAYPSDEDREVQKMLTTQRWSDRRGVTRGQGKIAAVLGELHGITERRNPWVPPNNLVCIDEQTGKPLWQRTSGVFREDEPKTASDRRVGRLNFQHTHFTGTPIISHGKVYTMMRRASREGDTQSNWLMAYDAVDGSLLWYRHLALVALAETTTESKRVAPRMTLHGDTLYICDALGSIGAIDAHTGGYHWLRVLPIGSQGNRRIVASTRRPSSGVVVTSAGLLVPLSIRSDRLMLVDPTDGSLLRSFKEDPILSKTQDILPASGGALVVSQTAVSYWNAQRAGVAWTFTLDSGEAVSGLGDITLRFAVFPTNRRLIVLDMLTGELIEEAPAVVGNLVVRDSEMLAISEGRLHAYTSWERVYDRLIEQVQIRPEDPSAGLSLASIAMRQEGEQSSVLLGVGYAMQAVSRQPPRRQAAVSGHVFDQLRVLIPQTDDRLLRGQLYDRLALVTQTASHEAAYHLDAGLYYASQGETRLAVDHLHAVIAEPAFAGASYEIDELVRPAGAVAQHQLQELIARYGRDVYARQDAMAHARIEELKATGHLNAGTLTSVTQRYPLFPLVGQLLLEAAQARAEEGRLIAAAGLYKQAMQRAVDDTQRQLAAGRLLQFYIDTGRPGLASDFLDRFTTRYKGLKPTADGQTMSIAQWQDRIANTAANADTPTPLAPALATPALLNGRLIRHAPGGDGSVEGGKIYLHHDDHVITCRGHKEPGKPLWTAKVPADSGRILLLADHTGQVVFWAVDSSRVLAFNAASGEALWQAALQIDTPLPPKADLDQLAVLVAVSETVVCFAHRDSAQVVAIDRASGHVLWRTTLEMTTVTAIDADSWSLAVVGRAGHPQQLRSGKLAILSLLDAKPILDEGLAPIALTPFGVSLQKQRAIVLGSTGVMAIELPSGRAQWTHRFTDKMLTAAYAIADHRIAVATTDGEVHLLDAFNQGKPVASVAVHGGADRSPLHMQADSSAVWCLSSRGVYCFGPSGLRWTDAIQSPRIRPSSLIVSENHVALIAEPNPAPPQNGLSLNVFEGAGGRLVAQYDIGPLTQEAQAAHAVRFGAGIAIPNGTQTLVIPPAQPED